MTANSDKLLVLDYNGCVLDDLEVAITAINRILEANDHQKIDPSIYGDKFNMPISALYKSFGFDVEPEATKGQDIYIKTVVEMTPNMKIRDDVDTLLTSAHAQGIKVIMVSNSSGGGITKKLSENGLDMFFADIIGRDHEKYGIDKKTPNKSDNLAAYLADHPAKNIVLVGDTFEEIEMAERFGGTAIAITGGYTSGQRLQDRGAAYVVDNFKQVTRALKQKNFFTPQLVV